MGRQERGSVLFSFEFFGVEAEVENDPFEGEIAHLQQEQLTAPEVAALARHANPRVTLGLYAGLADDGREKAVVKLAEGGFGR
jgi:hypothetical protein